jgi:hypothetical protein
MERTKRGRGEEAKNVEKNSKLSNPRFSQRKDITAILIEWSWKELNRALMIAVIQGKSNKVRWRDKRYDHCDCAIERRTFSDEESKEVDP